MSLFKKLIIVSIIGLFIAGVYGCKKEGTAERVGKKLDKAMEDAKDKLDDATK